MGYFALLRLSLTLGPLPTISTQKQRADSATAHSTPAFPAHLARPSKVVLQMGCGSGSLSLTLVSNARPQQ